MLEVFTVFLILKINTKDTMRNLIALFHRNVRRKRRPQFGNSVGRFGVGCQALLPRFGDLSKEAIPFRPPDYSCTCKVHMNLVSNTWVDTTSMLRSRRRSGFTQI